MATSAEATRPADQITFAHNSERQFARLLDFYRVEWEYEPTAFPIEWDAAGQPTQRLVTKKNRKVRRLRELYPDVRIKVLYQRDYLSLLAKYGLEPPSQMLDPAPEAPGREAPPGLEAEASGAGRGPAPLAEPAGPGQELGPRRATRAAAGAGAGPSRAAGAAGPEPYPGSRKPHGGVGGAVERARAAGRPRVVPDPPWPLPPLPADPELVRLAQVLLPAERAHHRGPATAERAG
jgi:hypothetical protein